MSIDLAGAKVLVVEDEFFIASDLVSALRTAGAQPVGPAGSLEQAQALLEGEEIDAAIFDVNLHGAFTYPLISVLSNEGLPCVILSGYAPETLPETLRHLPSLEKPIAYERVIQSLATQLMARTA
jgi:DNA-binding NtrC family response regulator